MDKILGLGRVSDTRWALQSTIQNLRLEREIFLVKGPFKCYFLQKIQETFSSEDNLSKVKCNL